MSAWFNYSDAINIYTHSSYSGYLKHRLIVLLCCFLLLISLLPFRHVVRRVIDWPFYVWNGLLYCCLITTFEFPFYLRFYCMRWFWYCCVCVFFKFMQQKKKKKSGVAHDWKLWKWCVHFMSRFIANMMFDQWIPCVFFRRLFAHECLIVFKSIFSLVDPERSASEINWMCDHWPTEVGFLCVCSRVRIFQQCLLELFMTFWMFPFTSSFQFIIKLFSVFFLSSP